jgi:DNA-binding Lrp family transcriptional regulator
LQNQPKLDEIDAKILKILLEESRTSFTDMSKSCNISVGAVRMRYKNLWAKGIINGEIMLVNPYSLRYKHVSLIGVTTTQENENQVMQFLQEKPFIGCVFERFGKYDIGAQVAIQSIEELSEIQRTLEAHPLIKHVEALIFAGDVIAEHPENLIVKPFSGKIEHRNITPEKTQMKMDETDIKIVQILTAKSRTPFRQIGEQLDISTKNAIDRYKRLRGKVLTLSTITVNLDKLGYQAGGLVFIKLTNKSKIEEVAGKLLTIPNVLTMVKYIGNFDLFAFVVWEDFNEYLKMEDEIKKIKNVNYFDIHVIKLPPAWPPNLYSAYVSK